MFWIVTPHRCRGWGPTMGAAGHAADEVVPIEDLAIRAAGVHYRTAAPEVRQPSMFKLIATVKGGSTSLPQVFIRYGTVDEARAGAKELIHENSRVMRVMIVADDTPTRFVEWIER